MALASLSGTSTRSIRSLGSTLKASLVRCRRKSLSCLITPSLVPSPDMATLARLSLTARAVLLSSDTDSTDVFDCTYLTSISFILKRMSEADHDDFNANLNPLL
ncbi:hypothetical protein QCA50_004962 [Cerrena zonata]|uniref:Uncharacterized protein n=1 Tax=Cerrena zonata TaxID=2478898 RepID=A0AAW0GMY7_9APHY